MLMRIFAIGLATVTFGALVFVDGADSTAFAGDQRPIDEQKCQEKVTFQAFQDACKRPTLNGWQYSPGSIEVKCTKRETLWLPHPVSINLPLETRVDLEVCLGAKKKCVGEQQSRPNAGFVDATCMQYKEVERKYERSLTPSCADIEHFHSAIDLCDAAFRNSPTSWTLIAPEKPTGRIKDTCAGQPSPSTNGWDDQVVD